MNTNFHYKPTPSNKKKNNKPNLLRINHSELLYLNDKWRDLFTLVHCTHI